MLLIQIFACLFALAAGRPQTVDIPLQNLIHELDFRGKYYYWDASCLYNLCQMQEARLEARCWCWVARQGARWPCLLAR